MTSTLTPLAKFTRHQSCLVSPPDTMGSKPCRMRQALASCNLIDLQHPGGVKIRYPMKGTNYVYYTVQLLGDGCDYPTPEVVTQVQEELREIFMQCGVGEPISCVHKFRADEWVESELRRFDEVVGGDHGQEHRLHQQKFRRTHGEALLVYQIPKNKMLELSKAMQRIDEMQVTQRAEIPTRA